ELFAVDLFVRGECICRHGPLPVANRASAFVSSPDRFVTSVSSSRLTNRSHHAPRHEASRDNRRLVSASSDIGVSRETRRLRDHAGGADLQITTATALDSHRSVTILTNSFCNAI